MRNFLWYLSVVVVLALGAGTGQAATDEMLARTDGDLIGRFHFAGTAHLAADPMAAKLNQLGALPETTVLRDAVLQRLATTPYRLFKAKLANGNTNDFAVLLRPLLDDLLREESYAEMRGPSDAVPEFMLAVHLNSNRAKVWEANLAQVLTTWTGLPVKEIKGDGFTGWELKKHLDPNLIRCLHVGDWVLFGWGQNELRLQPGFVQRIKANKRPVGAFKQDFLEVMMDWPTYMRYHPFTPPGPLPAKLPKMHLTVEARKDYVRPKLVVQYAEPLNLNLEAWKIPTETIHNPIDSFVAARGIAPWLSQLEVVKKAQLTSVPNQIITWKMGKTPFSLQFAMPERNAGNYLAQNESRLVSALNDSLAKSSLLGQFVWTNQEIRMAGMPFIGPYLRAVHQTSGEYLTGGLMPAPHRTNETVLPSSLLNEIYSKPNLVYYGWEINEDQITESLNLNQIYLMISARMFPPPNAPGVKWLTAAKSKMGNCGTEVTLTAPDELTLVRNAPVGLTAMEMVMLEHWIDAPGFPLEINYPKPLRSPVPKRQAAK